MSEIKLSETVMLRQLEVSDAEAVFNAINENRPYLKQWLGWVDFNTEVKIVADFLRLRTELLHSNGAPTWGIFEGDLFIGTVSFHPIDKVNMSAAVGYWLAQSAEGRGLMTQACQKLLDYGFENLKLNRIEIRCAIGNRKSAAVPQRLGCKKEGVLREAERIGNIFHDQAVYSILRSEWKVVR